MTTPAGDFAYSYDAVGRMSGLVNPSQDNFAWTYRDNNSLETQRLGSAATTTYSYAPGYGWMTGLTNRKQDAEQTVLSQFNNLQYDPASNLTSVTARVAMPNGDMTRPYDGVTNYSYASQTGVSYESKDELTQEQSTRLGSYIHNFRYDNAGNPTTFENADPTVGQGYNTANQNNSFGYDGNGNPITYKGITLTFDPENCMTSYGNVLNAGYSAGGLRAWKQTAQGRTYFLYNNITPICELDSSGNVTAFNTFGEDRLLSRQTNAQNVFYAFDLQGSVVQRLDINGVIMASHLFNAFGNQESSLIEQFNYGAQWGYYADPETNIYLCGFRYYDSTAGRFINRDPIRYIGGINLYAYVANNVSNRIDPYGLNSCEGSCGSSCSPNLPPGFPPDLPRIIPPNTPVIRNPRTRQPEPCGAVCDFFDIPLIGDPDVADKFRKISGEKPNDVARKINDAFKQLPKFIPSK